MATCRLAYPRVCHHAWVRIYPGTTRRHYEETLRSLGLVLDTDGYRHISLVELDDGFLVTGLRYSTTISTAAESIGRWACVATRFGDDEIDAMLDAGLARRGSCHRAQPYERSLRLLGMWLDDQPASRVTVIDQAGTFLLRALPPMPADPPFLMMEFTPDLLAAMARKGRRERRTSSRRWLR